MNQVTGQTLKIYNDQTFCTANVKVGNPWQIFVSNFIGTQNVNSEMFAFGFQNCSGLGVYNGDLETAESSLTHINTFFNGTYWPGGCP
jgi:hypothetical protein